MLGAKICGVTRPSDAALASRHGALRIGIIFAGGPREVTPEQGRAIVDAAGPVPVLAVVRAAPAVTLLRLVEMTGVRGLQLHGTADDELVRELRATGLEVWRQLALRQGDPVADWVGAAAREADAVVVEPRRADGRSGGLGIPLDLDLAREARLLLGSQRMVLAGGLTPESVAGAIRRVEPDLVDVSSGIESAPGIKDPGRLLRFLEEVRDVRSPD